MEKHKVRLRISVFSPYEEEDIFRTIEGYTDMDMSDREDLYYTLDNLDKHGSNGLDMYDHGNAGVRTLCAAFEAGVSDDIDDVIYNIESDHYYMTGTKSLLEEAKYLLMFDDYWGTEENPGIFTPEELAEKLKSDSTYHETTLGVLKTMRKIKILTIGKDFNKTVEGYTGMPMEGVHKSLDTLDENELKTFCAAMEVYKNIDMVLDNVKDGSYYLTGSETLLEEANYILANDEYWDDNRKDITPEHLAWELDFDNTYHKTTFGVLRTI